MRDRLQPLVRRFRALSRVRRGWLCAAAILCAVFLLVLLANNRASQPVSSHPTLSNTGSPDGQPFAPADWRFSAPATKEHEGVVAAPHASVPYRPGMSDVAGAASEPRIAYSAELAVATKEFVHSRASLEEILERHRGYVAKLRMLGQPAGSLLSATLRIPSSEYSSTLCDLKSIGRVEREEESADEITQQHGDLEARLINAQNTEQRLQRMLETPQGKASDLTVFARQLATLRAEIEHLQAERQAFDNRAVFSSVFFSMREEVASPAVTLGAQLRNAVINGFSDAASSLSGILIFAMNYGPSLVLWGVVLFLPVRYLWRRSRPLAARTS
jgi:Domain of unknown function (DUF4349)